eukprot:838874_1
MHNLIYLLDKFNCRFIVDRVGNSTAQRQGSRTHTTSNRSNYDPMLGPQTLIAMGFASSDSLNVAQIFGSIVEGAIENLFNASACNTAIRTPPKMTRSLCLTSYVITFPR